VQARFAEALEGMTRALGEYLARKPSRGKAGPAQPRACAADALSELVARLVLARAVAAADPPSPTRSSPQPRGLR